MKKPNIGLYRFYNMNASDHGVPFSLCEKHFKTQLVPKVCVLTKMADNSLEGCVHCHEET